MLSKYKLPASLALILSLLIMGEALGQQMPNPSPTPFKSRVVSPMPAQAYEEIQKIPTVDGRTNNNEGKNNTSKLTVLSFPALERMHELRTQNPDLDFQYDADGVPINLQAEKLAPITATDKQGIESQVLKFLHSIASILQLQNPEAELTPVKHETDELGITHLKFQQKYEGLEVFGGQLLVQLRNGYITGINGNYYPTPRQLPVLKNYILPSVAMELARHEIAKSTHVRELSTEEKNILNYNEPSVELVIYPVNFENYNLKYAYRIETRPNFNELYHTFINPLAGEENPIIYSYNATCSGGPTTAKVTLLDGKEQTINTYEQNSKYYLFDGSRSMFNAGKSSIPKSLIGALAIYDLKNKPVSGTAEIPNNSDNKWTTQKVGATALHHLGRTYDYFKTTHAQESIDNQGMTINAYINATNEDGTPLDNALWNGQVIVLGNGNTRFTPLAGAQDIVAHEITHGLIGNTARLIYSGQSGAINESMADVFGAMVDRENWKIGEKVVKTSFYSTGALRDMSNPTQGLVNFKVKGYQPDKMSLYNEAGGVHYNSGIPNFAFYKYATATNKNDAEKVYFRALTRYLNSTSQFVDLRNAVQKAADDLFPPNSPQRTQVGKAFDAVGILKGQGQGSASDLPPVVGNDYIIATSSFDGVMIYDVLNNKTIKASNRNTELSKISVTENGKYAYFVDVDHKIIQLDLTDIENPKEKVLTIGDNIEWYGATVDKQNKVLALNTIYQDSSVYVYHIESQKLKRFMLYTPNTSDEERLVASRPQFCDITYWHYQGNYLYYDALYKYQDENGEARKFWNIAYINLWDSLTNDFGDGRINFLLSAIPEHVHIGNPNEASNSPHILSYDYVISPLEGEGNDSTYILRALNFDTQSSGILIPDQKTLSYPSYSPMDDQIAVTTVTEKNKRDFRLGIIDIQTNKISGTGAAIRPIASMVNYRYPIWFVQGKRVSLEAEQYEYEGIKAYPIPFKSELNIEYQAQMPQNLMVTVTDVQGKLLYHKYLGQIPQGTNTIKLNEWASQAPNGTYFIHIVPNENGKKGNASKRLSLQVIK